MNIPYIKERLMLMKQCLENSDHELVGLDSRGLYGIDVNDDEGGNVLKCSIDDDYIRILIFNPFASVLKNKKKNQLVIEYKFEQIKIDLNDKAFIFENLREQDLIFIQTMLDFFEEKKKAFFQEPGV